VGQGETSRQQNDADHYWGTTLNLDLR